MRNETERITERVPHGSSEGSVRQASPLRSAYVPFPAVHSCTSMKTVETDSMQILNFTSCMHI
jgi:hypothetical protein